jgi:hypothetical protein
MKTKTNEIARPRRSLLRDNKGAEYIQSIILMVALALAGLTAVKTLSGAIGEKMGTTGEAVKAIQ